MQRHDHHKPSGDRQNPSVNIRACNSPRVVAHLGRAVLSRAGPAPADRIAPLYTSPFPCRMVLRRRSSSSQSPSAVAREKRSVAASVECHAHQEQSPSVHDRDPGVFEVRKRSTRFDGVLLRDFDCGIDDGLIAPSPITLPNPQHCGVCRELTLRLTRGRFTFPQRGRRVQPRVIPPSPESPPRLVCVSSVRVAIGSSNVSDDVLRQVRNVGKQGALHEHRAKLIMSLRALVLLVSISKSTHTGV